MAPPQVDLTKKQPLEDVEGWAKQIGDEKLPPMKPAHVPVETGTKVAGKRVLGKKRCKKLIIGFIIGAVVAAAITAGAFLAHRRHSHHWRGHVEDHEGHQAEEEYRTEGSKRLIYIARNESHHFFRLFAVLDYSTQLAGFKDCRKQQCYVDRLRESYEDGCARWRHFMHHSRLPSERPLKLAQRIDPEVLRYIAGDDIYAVCGSIPAYWVLEIPPNTPHNGSEIIYL